MEQSRWQGPLHELTSEQTRHGPVDGSQASVSRSGAAIDFTVRTSRLTPGNAYTLWLMAFNNPDACDGTDAPPGFRCGPSDMGRPEAAFGLMFSGAGDFAATDTMEFSGRRVAGDSEGVELGTAGLTDPARAEIHLRIRDHGPAQPGLEGEQVGTIMGGCTPDSPPGGSGTHGTYACRDVQATGL